MNTETNIMDTCTEALAVFCRSMRFDNIDDFPNEIKEGLRYQMHPATLNQLTAQYKGAQFSYSIDGKYSAFGFDIEKNISLKPGEVRFGFQISVSA